MPRSPALGQANTAVQLAAALVRQRAAQGRRRRYVRWAHPLAEAAGADAWAWGPERGLGCPDAAWRDPAQALSFAAYGRVATVGAAHTPAGSARVRRLLEGLCMAWPIAEARWRRLPVLVGSLPFFAHATAGPRTAPAVGAAGRTPGPAWPRDRPLVVPRLLCMSWGAERWLVQTAVLPTSAAGCRALASRWWRTVQREPKTGHVPATSGARAAAPREPPELCELEDEATFSRRVAGSLRRLAAGSLHKVVLARAVCLRAPPATQWAPWATALQLRRLHPTAKVFLLRYRGGAAFVGATPELLLELTGGRFVGAALAGTRQRGADAAADGRARRALLASAKDLGEHAAVVAGLRVALASLCSRLQFAAAPVALATRQLWHLFTPVAAGLRPGRDALHLVAALHPTPAVGGTPTDVALRQLRRQEPWRGDYAAPVGWLGVGDAVFAVALRSALLRGARAWAFAGAGIVADSVAAAEWAETQAKLRVATGALVATG